MAVQKNFKRFISLFMVMLMISLTSINCFAGNISTSEMGADAIIQNKEVQKIRSKYDLTSKDAQDAYLTEIFGLLGVSERFVSMLNEQQREAFLTCEKYGVKKDLKKADVSVPGVSVNANGSAEKIYDDMHLILVWANDKNDYTFLATYEWLKAPTMRLKDIIGIDVSGGGSIDNNSRAAAMQYTVDGVRKQEEFNADSKEYIGSGSGCGFQINLPNRGTNIGFIVGYSIKIAHNNASVTSEYFHKFLTVAVGSSIDFTGYGMNFSFQYAFTRYGLQSGL